MKFYKLHIVLVLLVALGCDVLDQSPQTAIDETTAIRDQKSAEAALNGLYDELQSGNYYGDNIQIISDVTSDISQSIGTWDFYREMDTYVTSPGNQEVRNLWSQLYRTVNHANNIIADVPGIDATQAVKDQILGEAYFIRALAYFDLSRTFAGIPGVTGTLGVPIVTEPSRGINESSFPNRPSIQDSYDQVLSDLQSADGLLTGLTDKNRASAAAVQALYARVHLYLRDYDLVEQYATDVIDNFGLTLEQDYNSIFVDENSSGSIFELAYNTTDGNGIRGWYFPSSEGGRGDIALHLPYALNVLSRADDERGNLIALDPNIAGAYYPTKFSKSGGDNNIPILRLSEMFLNRAEARANATVPDLVGALEDLNEVRNRANLADTLGAGVDTPEEVLEAIAHERGIEFMMEGHRFYDLVRTGKALTVLVGIERLNGPAESLTNAGRQIFPIPSREIDANKNIDQSDQNDAYK